LKHNDNETFTTYINTKNSRALPIPSGCNRADKSDNSFTSYIIEPETKVLLVHDALRSDECIAGEVGAGKTAPGEGATRQVISDMVHKWRRFRFYC